jgi:hypothetical protein
LEGKKGSAANTPTQTASNQKNVKSAVSALSSTSSSFGTAATSTKFEQQSNGIDEALKAQALAEEEAAMNQYKSKMASPTSGGGISAATNPFLSSPPASSGNIVDLFGPDTSSGNTAQAPSKASDDLLQLGNPFADMFGAPAAPVATQPPLQQQQPQAVPGSWMSNGFNGVSSAAPLQTQNNNTFVTDSNFSSVFGNSDPVGAAAPAQPQSTGKVLTGDLDSSLASLAENLSINKSASSTMKGMQWNSPKNQAKPGAQSWSPQPMAATTGANYRPMQGMPPQMPGMRPMMGVGVPQMAPMGGMGMPMGMPGQPGVVPLQQPQQPLLQQQPVQPQQPPANSNIQLDPFGA